MAEFQFKTYQITAMTMPFTLKFVMPQAQPLPTSLPLVKQQVATFLNQIDRDFSPFQVDSLVSKFQRRELLADELTPQFQEIYGIAVKAQTVTNGAFNPFYDNKYDPTGLVKGWAIQRAFEQFIQPLITNNTVTGAALNGAGDIQMAVNATTDFRWHVAIENPNNTHQVVWQYEIANGAMATSGFSQHANHIQTAHNISTDLSQVTIVAPELIEADVLATAAIAMGAEQLQQFRQQYFLTGIAINQQQQIIQLDYLGGQ